MNTNTPGHDCRCSSLRKSAVGFGAPLSTDHPQASCLACTGSAERVGSGSLGREVHEKVGSSGRRLADSGFFMPSRRRRTGQLRGQFSFRARLARVQGGCGSAKPPWLRRPCEVVPNPSLEARPNGRPPGPVWRYAYIFASPGLASCRWSRLSSNVRHQRNHRLVCQQEVRLSA